MINLIRGYIMKTIRRRKRRRLSKQTKIFLSFTILVLGLIGLCLFSYPKLDLKAEEIDIGLEEDFNYKNYVATIWYKDVTNKVSVSGEVQKTLGTYYVTYSINNGPFKTSKVLKILSPFCD